MTLEQILKAHDDGEVTRNELMLHTLTILGSVPPETVQQALGARGYLDEFMELAGAVLAGAEPFFSSGPVKITDENRAAIARFVAGPSGPPEDLDLLAADLRPLDKIEDPTCRAQVLAHWLAASLHWSLSEAVRQEGLIFTYHRAALGLFSSDGQRCVWSLHRLEQAHVDVLFHEQDRGLLAPRLVRRWAVATAAELSPAVERATAEICAFLLHGHLPVCGEQP